MLLSFKTALIPHNKQETLFRKASGTARHAYNWANAQIQEILAIRGTDKTVKLPTAIDLHKKLVVEVKSVNQWYYEVNKNVPQKALADCRTAWDRCLKKISKRPRFKKKGQHDSFYLESGTKAKPGIKNDGKRVRLPSIGWVRLA
ncbi:MAG: helix-turn-helix domain-containing protein, partial [Geitlerinemataceae cyanobacterium]